MTFASTMDVSLFTGNAADRRLQPLCTIPQQELSQYFPQIAEQLCEDSYFSINSYYIPKYRDGTTRRSLHPDLGHLPFPEQGKRKLRQINACFADLDTYNVRGLEPETAFAAVQKLAREGYLPQPSLFVDSGRGLWPVWLLHDNRDRRYSPPAFESLVNLSERVNRELTRRLSALGSDRQAVDAARFLRVPGSRNSKAPQRRVGYFIALDQQAKAYTYSLEQLAELLDIKRPRLAAGAQEMLESDMHLRRRGQSGSIGRWARELQRFDMLRTLRAANASAFPKGQRSRALRFYAGLLVRVRNNALNHPQLMKEEQRHIGKMTDAQIRDAVRALVDECAHDPDDRITQADADAAVRSAINGHGIGGEFNATAQTIADWFQITPEEAQQLPESNRQPFPFARSFDAVPATVKRSRAEESKMRRDLLRIALPRLGSEPPTLRALRLLVKSVGIDCTERTLMKDLAALGIENPRSWKAKRAGRQRVLEQAAPLFSGQGSEPRSEPFRTVPNLNSPNP